MKTIVVASTNPVKVQAATNGLQNMFPDVVFHVVPVSVASNVRDQPCSDAETLTGAINRTNNARMLIPDADYWVGIEGGVEGTGEDLMAFAWIVVRTQNLVGKARTGTFFLPRAVSRLVQQGFELGEADDIVFRRSNSKQENGAVGILTRDVINRRQLYEQAVILACIPFSNEELYTGDALV